MSSVSVSWMGLGCGRTIPATQCLHIVSGCVSDTRFIWAGPSSDGTIQTLTASITQRCVHLSSAQGTYVATTSILSDPSQIYGRQFRWSARSTKKLWPTYCSSAPISSDSFKSLSRMSRSATHGHCVLGTSSAAAEVSAGAQNIGGATRHGGSGALSGARGRHGTGGCVATSCACNSDVA